jgi:predicted ATPase
LRIRSITVKQWRNFENVTLQLDADASLVCIVGANGTGKSHLLELVGACSHRLGISQGIEASRGDPFSDAHDFSLQFYLAKDVNVEIEKFVSEQGFVEWDRTLTIESRNLPGQNEMRIEAGGISDVNRRTNFASKIIEWLKKSKAVHFVSLDADRSYPKKSINFNEIAQAYVTDWEGAEYTRGRSFKMTATLYDEWIKYCLAQENQSASRFVQQTRRAEKTGAGQPKFIDPFRGYAESLQKVFPHLSFTGVDSKTHTLLFDTTGLQLSFNQLSGGEREIAFLIGQIDRFGLRQGIFLLDEPELHLNADLIRTWIGFLTSTIETGQIWLATHSLEAVESAGLHSTFVLQRNEQTRKVDSLARLDSLPVLSALSRTVGTPAFSISKLLFVFIEGEEGMGEREQFQKLAGSIPNIRFMECGSCTEVLRRVEAIRALASESKTAIRIAGVIDRDFRTDSDAQKLQQERGVFVLPVHEKENLFLHPATVGELLKQNGVTGTLPVDIIRNASDARAGSWIFQYALSSSNAKSLPEINSFAKERAKSLRWAAIEADRNGTFSFVTAATGYAANDQKKLRDIMEIGANSYANKRRDDLLWKACEGKQVLSDVAYTAGFAGVTSLVQATFAAWSRDETLISEELRSLREYLAAL